MIIKENTQFNNQVSENIEKIRELFPNTVTESEKGLMVDFDKLKEELSSDLMDSKEERYQMTWPGKKASLKIANEPTDKTLIPDRESSVDFDNTQNIYIEGDNLEALKVLKKSYESKIKCIYIDPPYNTGNDFVYNDDFSEISEEYLKNTGIKNDEGKILSTNKETSGRYHSNWLTMMYPRLKIARDLLKEDGVIFISVDDNEQANLKKICDEIFGENNFLAQLIWKSKSGGANDAKNIITDHEYILVFAKNMKDIVFFNLDYSDSLLQLYNKTDEFFEQRGPYRPMLLMQKGLSFSKSLTYPITAPDGTILQPKNDGSIWRWSEARYHKLLKEGFIEFKKQDDEWKVYTKQYFKVDYDGNPIKRGRLLRSVITEYDGRQGTRDLQKLFDAKIFENPKSIELMNLIFKVTTDNLSEDIFLDFFSGSATSAHSIFKINSEDGGKRRFIMVQVPEEIDKDSEAFNLGFKNICEIAKERIRRAGKKIKEETNASIDYGFKVFKVSESILNPSTEISPNTLTQEALNFENIKDSVSNEDLIYFSILKSGRPLDSEVIKESIGKNEFFTVLDSEENNIIVACFDKEIEFNDEIIKMIADKNPLRVYFRDSSFKSDNDKINFEQKLKELSSESIEIYVL